jgi:hypothetical protein
MSYLIKQFKQKRAIMTEEKNKKIQEHKKKWIPIGSKLKKEDVKQANELVIQTEVKEEEESKKESG